MARENRRRGNDRTACALRQAFLRLKADAPTNPVLKALKKERRFRLTVKNVAIEAGVSRTLIAHKDCDYPDIRLEIMAEIDAARQRRMAGEEIGPTKGLDANAVIERLREKVIALRVENGTLFTKLAVAVRVARDLEGRLAKAEAEVVDDSPRAKRIAARDAKAARQPATPPDRNGTVIHARFPGER